MLTVAVFPYVERPEMRDIVLRIRSFLTARGARITLPPPRAAGAGTGGRLGAAVHLARSCSHSRNRRDSGWKRR